MQRTKLEDIPWMQVTTVNCLQTASGAKLTEMFDGANPCTIHDNRVTVMKKDLTLALRIVQDPSLYNWFPDEEDTDGVWFVAIRGQGGSTLGDG